MKTVAYWSPFVPPEWIAAHGMEPYWPNLGLKDSSSPGVATPGHSPIALPTLTTGRGVCAYAGAVLGAVLSGLDAAGVVLTTACDQMRHAAAVLEQEGPLAVFLMNIPKTWQTTAARELYRDELHRLGRFLVRLGGKEPSADELADVMLQAVHHQSPGVAAPWLENGLVPLALLGGPLPEGDAILGIIERAGGRVVLDATEGGERTRPRRFDPERTRRDPLEELIDAYFGAIVDVFRRPNDRLYEWLGHELAARQVRGIVFRSYLGCDLWRAELFRLRKWSPVPVLDLDAVGDDDVAAGRTTGRIEAFLEMLRSSC